MFRCGLFVGYSFIYKCLVCVFFISSLFFDYTDFFNIFARLNGNMYKIYYSKAQ